MDKNTTSKSEQYYIEAKKAFKGGGNDFFNDKFHVYEELLFQSLCKADLDDPLRYEFRKIFNARLYKCLGEKRAYDADYLGDNIAKTIGQADIKEYVVYFGVPLKVNADVGLPFGKSFILKDVEFSMISTKLMRSVLGGQFYQDIEERCKRHMKYGTSVDAVMRRFQFFKATVRSFDDQHAVIMTADAFNVMRVASTVAQERLTSHYTLGGSGMKRRSPIPSIGVMVAALKCDLSKNSLMFSSDVELDAESKLDFTKDKEKMIRYRLYRRICNNPITPIDKRIAKVLHEFSGALEANDRHLRHLGMWRCIEIALSNKTKNRTEKELVNIIGNYFSKTPYWKEKGKIIMQKRNLFVHQGVELDGDALGSVDRWLNWTQDYASTALSLLMWMRTNKIGATNESEINAFFDLYTKSDTTLDVARKMFHARKKLIKP